MTVLVVPFPAMPTGFLLEVVPELAAFPGFSPWRPYVFLRRGTPTGLSPAHHSAARLALWAGSNWYLDSWSTWRATLLRLRLPTPRYPPLPALSLIGRWWPALQEMLVSAYAARHAHLEEAILESHAYAPGSGLERALHVHIRRLADFGGPTRLRRFLGQPALQRAVRADDALPF